MSDLASGHLTELCCLVATHSSLLVPHMYSMPTTAQDAHSPIAALTSADGVKGAQNNHRDSYAEKINAVAANVFEGVFGKPI